MDVSQYLEIFIDETAEHIQSLRDKKQKKIEDIERIFYNVLESVFNRNLKESLINLSDQKCCSDDEDIAFYESDTFWSEFDATARTQKKMSNF